MGDYTPQRSVLYVPASNQSAVAKTASIDADWIVFDLEDSVSVDQKLLAREALVEAFVARKFGDSRAAIRCNAVHTEEIQADLESIAKCLPDAVLIPKVSTANDVKLFSDKAKVVGLCKSINTWFMIETASGIANIADIIGSASGINWPLTTLVVGHNDIASDTGVSLEFDRQYLIPWLMHIVLHSKLNELQVLDSVWNNFKDLAGFEREVIQAKQMGFDGKTLIHPSQVEVATRLFSPSQEEVARARVVVDAFAQTENLEKNVINIDGEMVEKLHLLQAERLLIKAKLSG